MGGGRGGEGGSHAGRGAHRGAQAAEGKGTKTGGAAAFDGTNPLSFPLQLK